MYEFTDFKKIDMHSHIGTWGNPFNFSGDINLVIDLMDKFNIEKTVLCPSDSSKNMDILEAYKKAKDKIIPVPWQIGLLAERHPKCKFVMLHMGHGHGIYVEAAQTIAKRYKNIWLETSGTSMTAQIFNAYSILQFITIAILENWY